MERCLGCMEICGDVMQCPSCGYIKGTPPKEIYHLTPGTVLCSKYTVGKVLGYGGFGVTYIGWDNVLERKVAIKEFLPGEFSTRTPKASMVTVYDGEATEQYMAGLQRFTDEAKRLGKLNGTPGIVGIYDTFIENNTGYIVMELLEGKNLKEVLQSAGVIPYERALEIIVAVLTVLTEVHKHGIIHRDISPDNIFITNDGEIKVIDFGAARYAATAHSKSLSVILKPGYAPEEQYRSHGNQGPWSDVYAVAATFYKLITGVTIPEAMERVAGDKIKLPSALGAVLPAHAENAIMNALIVDAQQRTRSAEDFLNDLQSGSVERVFEVRKKTENGKSPIWLKIITSVLAAAILATVAFVVYLNVGNKLGNEINVTSDGKIIVPNLMNKTLEEAQTMAGGFLWFIKPDFEIVVVDSTYNENVDANKIFGQKTAVGSEIEKGGKIEVVMSLGAEPVMFANNSEKTMPFVVYMSEENARRTIESSGCKVKVEYEYSDSISEGLVISQSVETGKKIKDGQEITITVSRGSKPVATPKPTKKPQKTPAPTPWKATPTPFKPTSTPWRATPTPWKPTPTPYKRYTTPTDLAPYATSTPRKSTPAPTPVPTPVPTPRKTPYSPGAYEYVTTAGDLIRLPR